MHDHEAGDPSVLSALFRHNAWANRKLLHFCAELSDAQLDATAIGGFGSIRETLQHIVRAEAGYVERVTGMLPPQPLEPDQSLSFDLMQDAASWASDELLQLALAARQDSIVQQRPPRQPMTYPLVSLMAQALSHSIEHRTQIATIVTQLGMEPPDMSGWAYMEETGELTQ